jgi:hypothetical protein
MVSDRTTVTKKKNAYRSRTCPTQESAEWDYLCFEKCDLLAKIKRVATSRDRGKDMVKIARYYHLENN